MNITIGNVRPKGICGSGLIIMTATLFELGIINSRGKFNRDLASPRIRATEGIYEYVLAWQKDTQIDRDIVLTEIDIENLIRAKGAIYSGAMTLLEEVGLSMVDVQANHLGGRIRQLRGSGKSDDTRLIAGNRPRQGNLRGQRVPDGSQDERLDQSDSTGRRRSNQKNDEF